MFNLATGLVDGLCDGDADAGIPFVRHVQAADLAAAAEEPRGRGAGSRRG